MKRPHAPAAGADLISSRSAAREGGYWRERKSRRKFLFFFVWVEMALALRSAAVDQSTALERQI